MSASLIENCNFLREYRKAWVLRFHSRPEYVGLLNEAMLALDESGRILAASPTAVALLEFDGREQLAGRPVAEVLALTTAMLHRNEQLHTAWPIRDIRHGRRFFVMLRGPERAARQVTGRTFNAVKTAPNLSLKALAGKDPELICAVRCAQRVMDKDVRLIILGETGTGKEAFARALHAESRRAGKPFVAINCSSIPESLIESELFGYKHGAFTGARREGMKGKIFQSSGGTLFLDEIGDMPAQLQTRLLRVLEEKEVLPLGSDTPSPVDLHVISATHRDLGALIAGGDFREDLYYRLNGLAVTLPPLRARSDKAELLRTVAAAENPRAKIDDEAMERLLAYNWPGNIRQLKNVLRTALILSEDQVLRVAHLPASVTQPPKKQSPPEATPTSTHEENLSPQPSGTSGPFENAEREVLLKTLYRNCWSITNTAASLNTSRNTLYRKMKKHRIPLTRPDNPCRH